MMNLKEIVNIKMYYSIAIIFILISNAGYTQTTFIKNISVATIDRGVTVEEVYGGGYIITGVTKETEEGNEDLLLIRTDKLGDTIWTSVMGGKGGDYGWAVRQTNDRGFIVVGYTDSFGEGGMDIYLIRTDDKGNELWSKTFGGEDDEYGWDIQRTIDGGFIIAAQTSSSGSGEIDAYLLKVDSKGNMQWAKTYGGDKIDRIFSVQQTFDGGYVATGITYSFGAGDRDAYLLKVDPSGEMEWHKTFGGTAYDVGHFVEITKDSSYLITGYGDSFSTYGKRDVYLIKADRHGNKEWLKTFGSAENERAMKGKRTKDNGYIIVGFQQVSGAGGLKWDVYLIKTNIDGEIQWSRTFGDINNYDIGYTVQETNDGGYIITGNTVERDGINSSVLLIKTDHEGKVNH